MGNHSDKLFVVTAEADNADIFGGEIGGDHNALMAFNSALGYQSVYDLEVGEWTKGMFRFEPKVQNSRTCFVKRVR